MGFCWIEVKSKQNEEYDRLREEEIELIDFLVERFLGHFLSLWDVFN